MNAQEEVIRSMENCEKSKGKDGKFFCPCEGCGKHFLQRKHLKQHLLKVHTKKTHKCPLCKKAFSTDSFLLAHERQCGKKFVCFECKWEFKSREALLMHAKRKGHTFAEDTERVTMRNITIEPKKSEQVHQSVQTTPANNPKKTQMTQTSGEKIKKIPEAPPQSPKLMDSSSQTTGISMAAFFDDSISFQGHFDGSLCDMETQTDGKMLYSHTASDPLLYSHIYTQTCDGDLLTELGLTDVQTQTTAWSDVQDFLVSTETQTSFTQCLEEECLSSFTTTYTQT